MHTYQPDITCTGPRWGVVDISFDGPEDLPDPFAVEFGALLSGPDGAWLRVPGFYDGGRRFVLRFSPPTVGVWTFETFSNLTALAGHRGTVEGTTPAAGMHGPIIRHPQYADRLAYADGTPYFLLAFEADWLCLLDCENRGDLARARTLVAQIAAAGFNQVVMNVYAYDVPWPKDPALKPEHEFAAPSTFPFGGSNDDPDFSVLNVAFFQHLDRIVQLLGEHGIVAHLMIYVWNKLVNWPDMYSAADNRYFDYVIARYQAFSNVVWDVSKEALTYGRCDMDYVSERIGRACRLDAYGRLLTVHDYAYCARHPDLVDVISIQTWRSDLHQGMVEVRDRHPGKPVFNIEHGGYERCPYMVFEGDYDDPVVCLERNYDCVFAGAYSTYYWQGTSWNVVIPDPMSLPEGERPRFDYYTHLATLFERYDFSLLSPVKRSSSGHCLSNGEGLTLLYLPAANSATHVTLGQGKRVQVTWFNPLTGAFEEHDPVVLRQWLGFQSPWPGQIAVLILQVVE